MVSGKKAENLICRVCKVRAEAIQVEGNRKRVRCPPMR